MVAKTFLQYASTISYYKILVGSNQGVPPKHQDLCEFYAQPFYPDAIADLFDNYEPLSESIYGVGKYQHVEIIGKAYSPMGKMAVPFGTLDQFIGDCQRYNVELTWKKEIIEKYFA